MSSGSNSETVAEKGGAVKCLKCSGTVARRDPGVASELCEDWFHGIDAKTYEGLKQLSNLHWFCDSCNSKVDKLLNDIAKIEKKQADMSKVLDE